MDEKLKRGGQDMDRANGRNERAQDQRDANERRELSDSERRDIFRRGLFQSTLPNLPDIPGYHTIWLTTQNPRDSIPSRRMIGYEPVTPEDVPGYEYLRQKDGEMAGYISVNEMVAFKIRNELYEEYMLENHHYQPLNEEEKLEGLLEGLKSQARGQKARIIAEEGSAALRQAAKTPTFS